MIRVSIKRTILERAEAALVRLALSALHALGPVHASNFAGWLARAIGPLLPVSRVADRNLRAAMPHLDRAARRAIVRGVWENLGRTVGELPHLSDLRVSNEGPGFEMVGQEHLAVLAQPGAAIMVSAHIGNWEALPPISAAYGVRFAGFYRAAANPGVDAAIMEWRQRAMIRHGGGEPIAMFAKGAAGARGAAAYLARGGYLGLLMDQKLNDGVQASFFGMEAMTAPAAAAFSLHFRAPFLMGHVERLGPARLRLVANPPLEMPNTGNRRADVAALTQAMNDVLEGWIRERPESWLWLHRRWPAKIVQCRIDGQDKDDAFPTNRV